MAFWQECKALQGDIVEMRRVFHRNPEFGRELPFTRKIVCDELDRLGVPYTLNQGDDGVIGVIRGAKPGLTVAFRADMDALHGTERTNLPFASERPGFMHACGHDAHAAMLLGAARVLVRHTDELHGTVKLLFESGEEIGTGGKDMIANGAMEGVDRCFGLHIGTLAGDTIPSGKFISLPVPVTAGKDRYRITVHGHGGHSGYPQEAVDPIPVMAHIILALQELHAREVAAGDHFALTVGLLQSGTDDNTIPDTAEIRGNLRTQNPATRNFIVDRVTAIAEGIARSFRATAEVEFRKGSSPVVNDPALAGRLADVLGEIVGAENVVTALPRALLGSDDFACYASMVPSVYYFLSSADHAKGTDYPHHNCKFDVDEDVLWKGAASFVAIAEKLTETV